MPRAAQRVYKFPPDFEGMYFELNRHDFDVTGTIHHINLQSNSVLLIENESVTFLDSIENIEKGIGEIDTVVFQANHLLIRAKGKTKELDVLHFIGKKERDTLFQIDLKNEFYIDGLSYLKIIGWW